MQQKYFQRLFQWLKVFIILILVNINLSYAQSPVPEGASPEFIAGGFQLCEGPYWHPDGYLLFSDVWSSIIYKWTQDSGLVPYLQPTGDANGIAADPDGHLIICQQSARQVGRIEADNSITPLASEYEGKRLHSPNDLAIKSDGAIFFTDPPWGNNPPELDFDGVYRIPPGGGKLQLLVDTLDHPNGIAFSPDESQLYIDDSNGRHIFVYDVIDDSTLANGKLFARVGGTQAADGMKVDDKGNVYVAGGSGVVIYSPEGDLLDEITITGSVTNLNFGDADGKTLYISQFNALYKVDMRNVTRLTEDNMAGKPFAFRLKQNYPNPFNPVTTINYQLPVDSHVELNVYSTSGQRLAVLVSGNQAAGNHSVVWNAAGFSSGIYFYRLTMDNGNQYTRKLLLLK